MRRRKPNYADLAESKFQSLCDDSDVSRNKATQDRRGWDFLVEFDGPLIPGLAHDQQPGSATARVQVKSTIGERPSTTLKLSNALRFTKEPDACFVVLFWFSKAGAPERIYARHFDRRLMEASLRRAREAERDGDDALHRIRIAVSFSDDDEHTCDLIQWMEAMTCEQQPEGYADHKRKLAETLGFEAGGITGSFTVLQENIKALIEHSVGLLPEAAVENVVVHNRRFGIKARNPIFDGKPDSFKIVVEPQAAILSVNGANGYSALFEGEVRSFILPGLPLEYGRAAFSSSGLSAVLGADQSFEISYELTPKAPYKLSELRAVCAFHKAARSDSVVSLEVKGRPAIRTSAPAQDLSDQRWFDWLAAILDSLHMTCRAHDDPLLAISDILNAEEDARTYANVIDNGELTLRFTMDRDVLELSTIKNLVGFAVVQIGNWRFWAVMRRPCLRHEINGFSHIIEFGDPILLDSAVDRTDHLDGYEAIRRSLSKASEKVGSGRLVMGNGDLCTLGRESFDFHLA